MATDKNFVVKNGLTINGSEVITSAGNLTNIGTINSGAITSTGNLLLDVDNAEINLKSGAGTTSGAVNWTFNTTGTDYASIKLPYATRATTGFHIDSGYPITVDATTRINFAISGNNRFRITNTDFEVGTTPIIDLNRNLTNIGTISSGDITITSSGTIGGSTLANAYLTLTDGSTIMGFDNNEIHTTDNLYLLAEAGNIIFRDTGNAAVILKNGSTAFMDASLNLTNIGTINSGAITASADISVVESSDSKIISNSVGDYFPSLEIKRTSGSTKTNYHWLWQLGSSGFLNLVDNTNSYYPVIFKNNGDVALANNTSAASPVLLLDQSAASATFSGTISSGDITASGSSGAIITAEHDGGGLADDAFIGGFLFKNNDTSGTEPHYAGMTARAVNIYGSMQLEFFADRADYENDTPAMALSPDGTDSSLNTLDLLSATKIQGITTITASGEIEGGSLDINGVADISGNLSIGSGTQTNNSDANLTIREGNAFAGFDLKSTRTSGNIGGLRFFNTSSDSVPKTQFLIETDGSYNFYNGSSGAQNRLKIDSSGNVGINNTNPQTKLHIEENNVGIPTNYGGVVYEAVDAQVDIISDSSGTWGSAINFVEGASTTANTNVWSIARKTTGGSGDSSLNFNFGTGNQHDNNAQVVFGSTGNVLIGTDSGDSFNSNSALRLQKDNHNYLQIKTPTTKQAGVLIGDTDDDFVGGFIYNNNDNQMTWTVNNTTALAISSSQNSTFYGNINLTSGHGYQINTTTVIDSSRNLTNIGTISGTGISTGANLVDLFNNQNGTNELRLDNNRQDLSNVEVSKVSGYNGVEVANMKFYRGGGGSSGFIRFQNKPTNAASLTDVFQIGDGGTVGYGVNILAGGLRVGGTTVIDSSRNLTATGLDLNGSADISGSLNMSGGHIYLNNFNIYDINTLTFNDPGPNEGISWDGGNTKIYESPDDLTTNTAGNLQFVYGSTRRLTVNTTGIDVNNTITTTYVDAETLKANDSGSTPGSCKLHVGSILSAGSSAVAQLGGFIRMSDQLIIHSGTSANTVFVKYAGGNIDLTEGEGSGANPATIVNDLTSTARGTGWTDHVNLVSSDGTNKWNLLVDSGASNYLRFGYNSTDQINFRPDGTIQCDKLIANEAASEFFVAGSASAQTIVAVLGSTSNRPTLLFSESTVTAINGGMSIEYDGRGSGDTNYMAINSVAGSNVFKVYSGGDVHLNSAAKFLFNGTSNYGIGAGGHNYNSGYFDTVESGLSTDPLELVYYQGRGVNIGSGASKNLGAAAIKLGGVDNTVESGYMLHLESTADAAILIEADTDNVTEGDNPKIRFRQDGGAVEAQIMLTANNDFLIDQIYSGEDILFGFAGVTKGTMTNAGNLTMTGNVTAYSDERLKTNIETLDPKKTLQMRGVSFEKEGVQGSGVIAQELEKVAPELVLTNDDEMQTKSVAYGNLVGYLIETIKEQQKDIEKLKEQVSSLTPKN